MTYPTTLHPDPTHTAQQFNLLIGAVKDYAIFMLDLSGCIMTWNPGAERTYGCTAEVIGQPMSIFYTPEDLPHHSLDIALRDGEYTEEGWRVRQDGSRFWASVTLSAIRDHAGVLIGAASVTHDITERRAAEETLRHSKQRLQLLTARLAEVETAERRQLVRELHDRAGQNLTALGINLNIIRAQLSEHSAQQIGTRLDDCLTLLEETTERIRDVMATLRPPVLEDYGLVAALRWYADSFTTRTEIPVTLVADDSIPPLAHHVQDALYRVVLEALNNAAKHAHAAEITIQFSGNDHHICIEVTDDGVGFEHDEVAAAQNYRHWGLQIMEERVESVGGVFRITTSPGAGTTITAEVPR